MAAIGLGLGVLALVSLVVAVGRFFGAGIHVTHSWAPGVWNRAAQSLRKT